MTKQIEATIAFYLEDPEHPDPSTVPRWSVRLYSKRRSTRTYFGALQREPILLR